MATSGNSRTPLRAMKSLKRIDADDAMFEPAQFWKRYDAGDFK